MNILQPPAPLLIHAGDVPSFARLNPGEIKLCMMLGERAAMFINAWLRENRPGLPEPHPMTLAMDFATAHACIPLRLLDLLTADDLAFGGDLTQILRGVNRSLAVFDVSCKLRFAVSPH